MLLTKENWAKHAFLINQVLYTEILSATKDAGELEVSKHVQKMWILFKCSHCIEVANFSSNKAKIIYNIWSKHRLADTLTETQLARCQPSIGPFMSFHHSVQLGHMDLMQWHNQIFSRGWGPAPLWLRHWPYKTSCNFRHHMVKAECLK